jgi:hypothetical protein
MKDPLPLEDLIAWVKDEAAVSRQWADRVARTGPPESAVAQELRARRFESLEHELLALFEQRRRHGRGRAS